jgi:NAD(P)-dependent dehydrogenase (short-subunit alcohol dehydrogenase family)
MPGALVTGAGRGLGLEIARRLVGRGYEVAIGDVDGAKASSAAQQLGDRAWGLPLDVTDSEAVRAAADQMVERSGSLDAWVNNAGILIPGLAHEQPIDAYRKQLDVNYIGTVNGTLAAIDRMRPAGSGDVINVISLSGLAAATGLVGYSASKHAAIAFSLGTAADLRRAGLGGIRISCVCPDGVWTPMIADRLDDPNDALSFSGVMMMPEQVAEHVDRLLDKPKAVLAIPRWRGRFARFFDRHPDLSLRATPLLMRIALRRQRAFKRKVESGKWPPNFR